MAFSSLFAKARKRCSVERYSSFIVAASDCACPMSCTRLFAIAGWLPPAAFGNCASSDATICCSCPRLAPILSMIGLTIPSSWDSKAASKCTVVTSGLPSLPARAWAAWIASWALIVSLSIGIDMSGPHLPQDGLSREYFQPIKPAHVAVQKGSPRLCELESPNPTKKQEPSKLADQDKVPLKRTGRTASWQLSLPAKMSKSS